MHQRRWNENLAILKFHVRVNGSQGCQPGKRFPSCVSACILTGKLGRWVRRGRARVSLLGPRGELLSQHAHGRIAAQRGVSSLQKT